MLVLGLFVAPTESAHKIAKIAGVAAIWTIFSSKSHIYNPLNYSQSSHQILLFGLWQLHCQW
jgi:hypothetical protein